MDAKIDNLLIRFPFATRDQVADALRQEGNHAGRAGVRLAKLDPSLDGGEANGEAPAAGGNEPKKISLSEGAAAGGPSGTDDAKANLAKALERRPSAQEVADRNILQAGHSPSMKQKRASVELASAIGNRKSIDQLHEAGIIPPPATSPAARKKRDSVTASAETLAALQMNADGTKATPGWKEESSKVVGASNIPPAPIGQTKVKKQSLDLAKQLDQRRDIAQLMDQGIVECPSEPPAEGRVKRVSVSLEPKFAQRPSKSEVVAQGIVQEGMSPAMKMKRASIQLEGMIPIVQAVPVQQAAPKKRQSISADPKALMAAGMLDPSSTPPSKPVPTAPIGNQKVRRQSQRMEPMLLSRMTREDLEARGIYIDPEGEQPSDRARESRDALARKMQDRVNRADLVDRNILVDKSPQIKMKRASVEIHSKIGARPSLEELVEQGLLPPEVLGPQPAGKRGATRQKRDSVKPDAATLLALSQDCTHAERELEVQRSKAPPAPHLGAGKSQMRRLSAAMEHKIGSRPGIDELADRNIIQIRGSAGHRAKRASIEISHKILNRPSYDELISEGLVPGQNQRSQTRQKRDSVKMDASLMHMFDGATAPAAGNLDAPAVAYLLSLLLQSFFQLTGSSGSYDDLLQLARNMHSQQQAAGYGNDGLVKPGLDTIMAWMQSRSAMLATSLFPGNAMMLVADIFNYTLPMATSADPQVLLALCPNVPMNLLSLDGPGGGGGGGGGGVYVRVSENAPPAPVGRSKVKRASVQLEGMLSNRPDFDELEQRGVFVFGSPAVQRAKEEAMERLQWKLAERPSYYEVTDKGIVKTGNMHMKRASVQLAGFFDGQRTPVENLTQRGILPDDGQGQAQKRKKRESITASEEVFKAMNVQQKAKTSNAPPAPIGTQRVKRASVQLEKQLSSRMSYDELQGRGMVPHQDGSLPADRAREAKEQLGSALESRLTKQEVQEKGVLQKGPVISGKLKAKRMSLTMDGKIGGGRPSIEAMKEKGILPADFDPSTHDAKIYV